MQSLFSTATNSNTFDTALNGQTYTAYNNRYKDTKNSLTEDIFEPQMLTPEADMQVDFQNNYNKEITINPGKDDITKRAANISAIQMANKYNPALQGKGVSELEREQKEGRAAELMTGHIAGPVARDSMHTFAMNRATQGTSQAQRDAAKAQLLREKFTPRPVDNGAFQNEDPDYWRVKTAQEKSLQQRYDLTNYRDMQRYGELDWRKRPMVPVKFLGNGNGQVKYGVSRAQEYLLTARKNNTRPVLYKNAFQKECTQQQLLAVGEPQLRQIQSPLDSTIRQILHTVQFPATGRIVNDTKGQRVMQYEEKYYRRPVGVQMQNDRVQIVSRGGRQIAITPDKITELPQQRALNYGIPAYAPYATNLRTQMANDAAFRVAANLTRDQMVYGSEYNGTECNIGEMI